MIRRQIRTAFDADPTRTRHPIPARFSQLRYHGRERARRFVLTLQAILLPITASRTSNLLRTIATLCGVVLGEAKFCAFMASVKLPWTRVRAILGGRSPPPLADGRLVLVLHDALNPKTGTEEFACQRSFDHAAKTTQSCFPWAQTIVTVGLPKVIHGRWCCLPLAFAFYLRKATLAQRSVRIRGRALAFETKLTQAVRLIRSFAGSLRGHRSRWSPTAGSATTACSNCCAGRSAPVPICSRVCA
jgi:hypothetical protein